MNRVLGLDVGNSAIKAVLMEDTLQGLRIRRFYHFPVKEAERRTVLQNFFAEMEEEFDRMVISLKGFESSIRIVSLPFADRQKVASVLPFELEDEFADGTHNRVFRFHKLASLPGAALTPYLVFAVHKEILHTYRTDFKGLSQAPYLLDYDACANFNCYDRQPEAQETGLKILLDIGAKSTGINILCDGELMFTRAVFFGGSDFTRAIAENLNLSFEDAEEIKLEYGFSQREKGSDSKIDEALERSFERLTNEINLTLGSFFSQHRFLPVESVILFGGGALLRGLPEYLADKTGYRVEWGNILNFCGLDERPVIHEALYSVAAGLALHGLGRVKIDHNFFERKAFFDSFLQKLVLFQAGALLLAAFIYFMVSLSELGIVWYKGRQLNQSYDQFTQAILAKHQGLYGNMTVLRDKISEEKRLLERFAESPKSPLPILNYLSKEIGNIDIQINEIHVVNHETHTEITLIGSADEAGNFRALREIMGRAKGAMGMPVTQKSGVEHESGRYGFEELLKQRGRM
jgi:type IV pilus assembly protein PilM